MPALTWVVWTIKFRQTWRMYQLQGDCCTKGKTPCSFGRHTCAAYRGWGLFLNANPPITSHNGAKFDPGPTASREVFPALEIFVPVVFSLSSLLIPAPSEHRILSLLERENGNGILRRGPTECRRSSKGKHPRNRLFHRSWIFSRETCFFETGSEFGEL